MNGRVQLLQQTEAKQEMAIDREHAAVAEDCRATQEDELLALESIFGAGEFEQLDAVDGMLCFKVYVAVELPEKGVTLRVLEPVQGNSQGSDDVQCDFHVGGEVKLSHVPPVVLSCTFPASYPAFSAPHCTLQSAWLDEYQLGLLLENLDAIWQPGEEVVFVWTEWLRENTMPLLLNEGDSGDNDSDQTQGGSSVLEVQMEEMEKRKEAVADSRVGSRVEGLLRAISGLRNTNQDLLHLVRYDRERKWETFLLESHECLLCFDEKEGDEFIALECCGQAYCKECLGDLVETHVKEKNVRGLRCPACSSEMHPSVVLKLLPEGVEAEEWEAVVLEKSLQTMGDIRYCMRCENVVVLDEGLGRCPHCFYTFCGKCLQAYHPGIECNEADRSADAVNEAKSIALMRFLGVQCPVCNIFVEKSSGCNKMTCTNCYAIFCFRCGDRIEGYSHFNGMGSLCPLFTDDRERFTVRGRRRHRPGRQRVEMVAHRHSCPTCKQENIKFDNNNDIHCWACRCNYCFLCRSVIKGTIHFRTSVCVQHSA